MANPHFAKFADIWKHLPLLEVLRIERPRRYWETHAGTASYPLTPSPERSYGIYHFLENAANARPLAGSEYVRVLAALPQHAGVPAWYPGSAMLAMLCLGAGCDRYVLCDKDPVSAESLENAAASLGLEERTSVVRGDGPGAIWTEYLNLPPLEAAEVLCHIDPFDSFAAAPGMPSSIQLFERLAAGGVKAVYWYAYERAGERGWLRSQLSAGTRAWYGDILLPEPDESGLIGLGVALANVSRTSVERCAELGAALERVYEGARLPSGARGSISFATFSSGL